MVLPPKRPKSVPSVPSLDEMDGRLSRPSALGDTRITPPPAALPLPPREEMSILHQFARLTDSRSAHLCRHELTDIVVIALCAVLGGADSWDDIALFGNSKKDFFARFLKLPNGIPSHDTFNRAF